MLVEAVMKSVYRELMINDHQYQSVEEMVVLNLFAFHTVHTRSELTISIVCRRESCSKFVCLSSSTHSVRIDHQYQSVEEMVVLNLFAVDPVHSRSELTISISLSKRCSKFACLPSSTHSVRTDHQYRLSKRQLF